MGIVSRIARREQPPPDYVITTALPIEQCRLRLTGRERSGWLGNSFAKRLELNGRIFRDSIALRLRSHDISGNLDTVDAGTRIALHFSDKRSAAATLLEWTIILAVLTLPIVAYYWWQGDGLPSFILLPVAVLAIQWGREALRRWPRFPRTPDDVAHMLANLIEGSVEAANSE